MSEDYEKLMAEQKAQCPFCKMVKGEIQVIKVYEDELMMAIMDINPATKGHILVFPKEHYPLMNMMPQEVFTHFFSKLKYIAQAQRKVSVTAKTVWYIAGGQAAGQRSLHFMVHMLPRQDGDELPLDLKTVQLKEERLGQLQHLVLETLGVNTKKKTLAKRLED
ncbi:MAG: HIT family protein, partial [Candidatus Woesearchaeota archaeon]